MTAVDPARRNERLHTVDGWTVHVDIARDRSVSATRAALTVPAAKHERDGWGPLLTPALLERGFVVMRTDVRGRGDSCDPMSMPALPPGQLQAVRGDVGVALDLLADEPDVAPGGIVVFGEQDTADAVACAALGDGRVGGLVLVSPRLSPPTIELGARRQLPTCVLVSTEDRVGLQDAVAMFARSRDPRSRLRLVDDVGSGTTMFAAWQYLRPEEPPLERWLAAWAAWIAP